MCKIIKADIQYYKWLFIWLYVFLMPFYIVNAFLSNLQEHLISIAFYTLPIIGIFASNEEKKSRRTRLHASLPVPVRKLGISRYPLFIGYWISLVFLFCTSVILSESATPDLWQILSITATGPFIAACMTIQQDLGFSKFDKITQIGLRVVVVLLAVIVAVLYFATYANRIFNLDLIRIFYNPLFALVLLMSAVALIFLSVRLFEGRSTYVM